MDPKSVEFFTALGINTGGTILMLILMAFFGRHIVEYFFNKRIELKKIELAKELESHKQQLDNQTEQLKLNLTKILEDHKASLTLLNTKYSKLHDKHLEIIAELYKRISVMEREFRNMTSLLKEVREDAEKEELDRIQKSVDTYNSFYTFYSENRIFFKEETAFKLDELRQKFFDTHYDYTFNRRWQFNDYSINKEHFDRSSKNINEHIPAVLRELEKNFRQLLTVE